MVRHFERGLQKVCNLSQGVYKSGYDAGVKKATVQSIVLLMKGKDMDIEECLDIFQIPEEKRDEYRETVVAELGITIC